MQGRFKRDGGAAGDPEPRGEVGHNAVPQPAPGADSSVAEPKHAAAGKHFGDIDKLVSPMRLSNWRISTRLFALLTLPVVAATSLGVLRIQGSLENVGQLEHMEALTRLTEEATLLADDLQEERDVAAGPITRGQPNADEVLSSRQQTDKAWEAFSAASDELPQGSEELLGVRTKVLEIQKQLQTLKRIRDTAYDNPSFIAITVSSYDQLINSLVSLSQDMALATSNSDMIRSTRALSAFSSAKEYESMQRAILAAALANKNGPQLSPSDRAFGQSAADAEDSARSRFAQTYGLGSSELTRSLDGGIVEIKRADEFRTRAWQSANGIKGQNETYLDWYDQATVKMEQMDKIEADLLDQMSRQARQLRDEANRDALINGALILVVLGVALVGAVVVARSMIRSLRRLQDTAQEVAQKRLPELVKNLSEAEPQDVDTSVESIGLNTRDEIGRVARAFDEVHREAVRLAAEQALLRGNVNAMFTNLSRRSQGLIQRQLTLISELESREADPDQLSNLFKLDHLATRMRRNGENLLVLAGEEPGRRWTRPVPLVDVLRAAASEVEQYERIELTAVPSTEIAGRIVNDLVHLLAELLENATSFSSPQTRVRVTGHALPDGRVLIEIHDTGIGLSPEDLADINERLANPPTVDVSVSRRMGLFVVGRLSLRHGIRIQLRPSDSGGTTALVMLPVDVTQGGNAPKQQAGRGGTGAGQEHGGPQLGAPSSPAGQLGRGASPRGQIGASAPAGNRELPTRSGSGSRAAQRAQQPTRPQQTHPQQTRPQSPQEQPQWASDPADDGRRPGGPAPMPAHVPQPQPQPQQFQQPRPADRDPVGLGQDRAGLDATLQFSRVQDGEHHQRPVPQQRPEPELPAAAEPMALPPAAARGEERTPIFESMESQWFRTGQAGRMQAIQVSQDQPQNQGMADFQSAAQPPQRPRPQHPPQPPHPQQAPQTDRVRASHPQQSPADTQPLRLQQPRQGAEPMEWRSSPNDERWRRAEQVREPQAGGVTPSGLPRRVPRANLVPGTAQSAPQGGPQVSRAPDDVRGRLTKLRRGIQQGRQASGTDERGFGPNHQER